MALTRTDNIPVFFSKAKGILSVLFKAIFSKEFFLAHQKNSCRSWETILRTVSRSTKLLLIDRSGLDLSGLAELLFVNSGEELYWLLVIRSLDFLDKKIVREIVGRDWLNQFYLELKSDIDELGREVYGEDYPDFSDYDHQTKTLKQPAEK